jgi:hypothetical protein
MLKEPTHLQALLVLPFAQTDPSKKPNVPILAPDIIPDNDKNDNFTIVQIQP